MLKILLLIFIVIVSCSEAGRRGYRRANRRGKYTFNLSLLIEFLKFFLICNEIKKYIIKSMLTPEKNVKKM
jgi:hypothetical protein